MADKSSYVPDLEAKIVEHLTRKHLPEVVLLTGSRAEAVSREGSDWDFYLIGKYSKRTSVAEEFHDQHLDVVLTPREDLTGNVYRTSYGPPSHVKVLRDNDEKLGDAIVEATRAAYESGPAALTNEQRKQYKVELNRALQKYVSSISDPISSFYYAGNFYRLALLNWFELRQEWPIPPRKSSRYISERDPEFFTHLGKLADVASPQQRVELARAVFDHLWVVTST